ncbi:MAG: glycoside hydrolase family 31 protein [Rubricoccaceae bacterium]
MAFPEILDAPAPPEARPDAHGFATLGAVHAAEAAGPHALVLRCEGGAALRLDALADDVLRLRLAPPGRAFAHDDSYALDPEATWTGPARFERADTPEAVVVRTAALEVTVTRQPARLVVANAAGRVLLAETAGAAWHAEGTAVAHALALEPHDRLLGLGDKALAVDRRGHRLSMWNTDAFKYGRGTDPLYKSVPFVLRLAEDGAALGLFYDNTFRSTFDLGHEDPDALRYQAEDGALDLYLLAAETPLGVVQQMARLTGRTPMLPRWALGYHQCRYSYLDEAEVRDVAREFRARRIPCDALYFDIHYMDGFRVFTWDRQAFPDPEALLAELHADGFRSVVIIDPGVKADDPGYAVFRDGLARDAYARYPSGELALGHVWPGLCAFPDYTRADVRAWWGSLHRGLLEQGVDGIWNDMNEPAVFEVPHVEGSMTGEEHAGTLPDDVRFAMEGRGGSHREAHNVYGMQMQRATHEGLRALAPARRPFTITRAAYAGSQRFGTSWTGDNSATWDHLRLAIQTCLSLGVSGMPFSGADVGGFVGTPDGELLARWTQVGALTPLFRNHSAIDTPRQEPWLFGEEIERVCREAIELRYRLLPYLYTALEAAAREGLPILRPLALVHPEDETIRRTSPLGFYVGPDLLAHPVVEPGQTNREVYLPASEGGWYDFASGHHYEGRQTVWIETPLDLLPLYVRGGSVLPIGPVVQSTAEVPAEPLELHVYPAPGTFASTLYDDAGDGYEYAAGGFWRARFEGVLEEGLLRLHAHVEGARVPTWPGADVVVHGLGTRPAEVRVGGAAVAFGWTDGAARFHAPLGASVEVVLG